MLLFGFGFCLVLKSNEKGAHLSFLLLINLEGSGKPLQLISTNKFAP